jgi:hypothetical protein
VIDRKYQHIVFGFFMALLMSCFMSLVISIFNVGFVDNILYIWLRAWAFAFTVAFPTVIVVTPAVRKLVTITLKSKNPDI